MTVKILDIPHLWDIITKADVSSKGTGFKADYVNWARTADLINEHANGWQFSEVTWTDSTGQPQSVFKAPDGTGYVKGQWVLMGTDFKTPPWDQAVMDNRHRAVPYELISSRLVTDSHRRCLCTSAAAAFSLAGKLWAKVEVEDPYHEDAPQPQAKEVKPARTKTEIIAQEFEKFGIGRKELLAWCDVDSLEEIEGSAEITGQLREQFKKCRDGMDPMVVFGIELAEGEAIEGGDTSFNFGENTINEE